MEGLSPKSKPNSSKSYVWVLMDVDGQFKAVCYEAPTPGTILTQGFWAKMMVQARHTFIKSPNAPTISPIITVH